MMWRLVCVVIGKSGGDFGNIVNCLVVIVIVVVVGVIKVLMIVGIGLVCGISMVI